MSEYLILTSGNSEALAAKINNISDDYDMIGCVHDIIHTSTQHFWYCTMKKKFKMEEWDGTERRKDYRD